MAHRGRDHKVEHASDGGSHHGYGPRDFADVLERASVDGWELVSVVASRELHVLFFKRPVVG
jgi:hypothetical protein